MKFYKATALSLAALLAANSSAFAGSCMSSNRNTWEEINTWEETVVPRHPSKAEELITLIAKNPNTAPKEKGVRISKIITGIAPDMAEQALTKTPTPFDYESFLNKLAAAKFDSVHPQFKEDYLPLDLLGLILSYLNLSEIQTLMQTSNVIKDRITKELNSWDDSPFRFMESLAYVKSGFTSENPSNLEQINILCTIDMYKGQKIKLIAERLVLLSKEELDRLDTSIFTLEYNENCNNSNNKTLKKIKFLKNGFLNFTRLIPSTSDSGKDWCNPEKYYSITARNLTAESIKNLLSKPNVLALKFSSYQSVDLVNLLKKTATGFEKAQNLKALDLSNRQIDLTTILTVLKHNTSVEKLNLSMNQIFTLDLQNIASIIEINKTLTTLDLSGCFVYYADFIKVTNALSQNNTLQNLYLLRHSMNPNPLNEKTIDAFLNMLKANKSLKHIYLSELDLKKSDYGKLQEALRQNKTLEGLHFYNDKTTTFTDKLKELRRDG